VGRYVPHRAPAWLVAAARRPALTRSPMVLSPSFHDRHHARPHVPRQDLMTIGCDPMTISALASGAGVVQT
jgi:hypothetical protein